MIAVSVVVPNYNSGADLERCLQSIAIQKRDLLEVIVVDAGSTDNSPEILARHRDAIDTLICEKDDGQADGINKGLRLARGEVLCWLCADDEWTPDAIEKIATLFADHPEVDVVLGACERIYPDGSPSLTPARPETWSLIGTQNVIDQPSIFWRRRLYERIGELDRSFDLAFDWDFWCRMRDAGAVLKTSDAVLSRYHFTATNKSGSAGRKHADESFRILRRYGPLGGWVAYVFLFLFTQFDLKGCYDNPPTCTRNRGRVFAATHRILKRVFGERLLYLYNWHFASCQERGLKWW